MTDSVLASDAISVALNQNWQEAIRINSEILKSDKTNIDALNRLGFAYLMIGNTKSAKSTFQKVLQIDEYNYIALKNIKKLSGIKKGLKEQTCESVISPIQFLEEPGKTKIVECINIAPVQILSHLVCGQQVFFKIKKHSVELRNMNNCYIGALPDDLAYKIQKLVAAGNVYTVLIKSVSKNCVSIFIREIQRGKRFTNQPSFIGQTSYIPSTKNTSSSHDRDEQTTDEEDGQEKEV